MSHRIFVRNYIANAVDIASTDLHYVMAVALHMPDLFEAGPRWDALIRSGHLSSSMAELGVTSPPPYHIRGKRHFEKWRRQALKSLDRGDRRRLRLSA